MPNVLELMTNAASQGLARIDAQMLMLHTCGRPAHDRAWLLVHDDALLPADLLAAWQANIQRRALGEPVAYITGQKAFYGLDLIVNAAVLDPRDDTEALVDWALECIPANASFSVLDLGTGSGAVALAIASNRPLAHICATDASPDALAVALSNAQALGLGAQCRFVQANAYAVDWFSALQGEVFDLIASNPPYIAEGDAHLAALKHEPAMALTSGKDGLDAIRSIIAHAGAHLRAGGHLLLEHGYDQASAIRQLFASHGFSSATTRPDIAGVDRCTGAQYLSVEKQSLRF